MRTGQPGGPERTHYRAIPHGRVVRAVLRRGIPPPRLLESNVHSSPPLMSEPNDRPLAPAGQEQEVTEPVPKADEARSGPGVAGR